MTLSSFAETRRAGLLVIGVALLARVAVLVDSSDAPTFLWPIVDADAYHVAAKSLAAGEGFDYRFFWQPFFYPTFLGLLHAVSGGSVLFAKIVQLALGVATCWMTFRVGRRLFSAGTGLLAGLICALHGPMIFFEGELVAAGWAAFWAIVLADRVTRTHPGPGSALFTGLLAALATLTRPTFLPAVVLAFAFVARRRFAAWAAALAGFAIVVLPVTLVGMGAADYAGFLPASGAMNLFLGNNAEPCETLTIRPGAEWQELTQQARPRHGGDLAANRVHFGGKLREEIAEHPGQVAAGLLRKAVQVVNGREIPRNVDPYFATGWSPVLRALMFRIGSFGFPMGILIPLAVVGVWSMRRELPAAFTVFLGTYLLGIVAVFVSARYRVPMVPLIAILGAGGALALARARRRAPLVAVLAGAAVLANVPGPFCEEAVNYRAETLYAVGFAQHRAGELEEAAARYAAAMDAGASSAEFLNQYALLRKQQGRNEEAIRLWMQALAADPEDRAARLNLASLLAESGRHAEALDHYAAVLGRAPADADALLGSGLSLLAIGRLDEGVARLERAVARRRELGPRLGVIVDQLRRRGEEQLAARLEFAIRGSGGPR